MGIQILGIDPRCLSTKPLIPPYPLPCVSRRALKRVKDRLEIPKQCHCCGGHVELVDNATIYRGRSYGDWPYAYWCSDCEAYVGLHPATDLPLGTLADRPLREARKQKGMFLDVIRSKFSGNRDAAYQWLADGLGIEKRMCHWGIFTVEQCDQAAQLIEKEIGENNV